jgi:DNA-3-methyladenine glycosylase
VWPLRLPDEDELLPKAFFLQPAADTARGLLGSCLMSTVGGVATAGIVVETEAYGGADDPASHAATRIGVTPRNRVMFGPPGRAYVYRSYGVHWCMNVVVGVEGEAGAVLLRGLAPLTGVPAMRSRRAGRTPLAAGPGRLAQALAIDERLNEHDLHRPPLVLLRGWRVHRERVAVSTRVGISAAADWPYRFYVRDAPGVSRPPGHREQE